MKIAIEAPDELTDNDTEQIIDVYGTGGVEEYQCKLFLISKCKH